MHPIMPIKKSITITDVVLGLDVVRPKDFNYSGEAHDFWEAVYVCDGKITVTGDDKIYHLSEGHVVFHKPMEFHRLWAEGNIAPHLMIISFRATGPDVNLLENGLFRLSPSEQKLYSEVTAGINQAVELLDSPNQEEQQKILSLTGTKLELLLQGLLGHKDTQSAQLTADEQRYVNIVKVMKANCDKLLNVAEIAKLCGMSTSNMKRIFSLYSNTSIAKFFLTLKMRRAMELLEAGTSTKQVALELGYTTSGYFCTVFKREIGIPPSQYKNTESLGNETMARVIDFSKPAP